MKDYSDKLQEVKAFIDDRLIITKDENDYVMCCDIHYFLNQHRDYRDTINYRAINKGLILYEGIYKKKFKNTVNIVGMKWRNIKNINAI